MNPIFNNNQNSSTGQNLFNSNNRSGVNLFTNNAVQNQNQNIQNQPVVMPNQPNPSANRPVPSNARNQDSLQENHSFITILQKITSKQKISTGELEFVTKKGLLLFETDDWKTHYFLNVKSKEAHLGFGPEELLYKGQMQKCDQINQIWTKIVRHFAYICETNEMNGYFLLKKILSEGRYYQNMYRPKQGLGNKVFEPNSDQIIKFFLPSQTYGKANKPTVNAKGKIYVEILQKMVETYAMEWISYFNIIEKVGVGMDSLQEESSVRQPPQTNQSTQNQTGTQLHRLKFSHLLQENIMLQLWKTYKKFALSEAKQPGAQSSKIDTAKSKWTDFKRIFFRKISDLFIKLLQAQFTQEMLMENPPIPLLEAIDFVTKDIEKVQIDNLIEPNMEGVYIEAGLNLILASIPFASYILDDFLITSFFSFPSEKNKFINARQLKNRQELLHQLAKIRIDEFEPLVIWAKLELKRIQNRTAPSKIPVAQREKERKQEAVETWENYFQKGTANYDVFEQDKWKHWVGLLVQNVSIDAIIQSTILRNHFVYYCKRAVKGRGAEFFRLWEDILHFEYSHEYRDMENTMRYLQPNPTAEEKRKPMYILPPKILRNFDIYTVGRFLRGINETNYLTQALNVFTTLIKRRKDEDTTINYTKKLLFFLQISQQLPQEQNYISDLFQIVIGTLSLSFGICCKKKTLQNQINDYSQVKSAQMQQRMDGQPMDYEVKFFCELVIQNMYSLQTLEGYIFDSREHLEITSDVAGIRTCIFLCKLLERIVPDTTSNIKSIRYLIRAIDSLFTNKQTHQLILCAISVVFPYDLTPKHQPIYTTRTTERYLAQRPVRRCAFSIVQFVQLNHNSDAQSLKQVQKLKKTLSYHFNHMIKSCDAVDQFFTINKDHDQPSLYKTIQDQTNVWKFTELSSFLKSRQKCFRASDWFYTIARVMQSSHLLPIDIDSIIQTIRKMRIPDQGNFRSFQPMRILYSIINRGTVLDQMLKFLKPIGCEHKLTTMIQNEKMAFYKPMQILIQQPHGTRYNKYQNKSVIQYKTARLAINQQYQLLRTICMYARLIQQVLRLFLDQKGFQNYSLIKTLTLVQQLLPKLTVHQHIHQFRADTTDLTQSSTKMNIIASLVSLLNLYSYQCKFPTKIPLLKQNLLPLLQMLQMGSTNNIAIQDTWQQKTFAIQIHDQNMDLYDLYRDEFQWLNRKYFETIMYEMTDFSFENDDTSLRSTIFSILQLLFQNKCGKTVTQALTNYSYPIICTGHIQDYSLTNKYLLNNDHKNITPLLFHHANHMLNLLVPTSSLNPIQFQRSNLSHIVRTIQSLSVFVPDPFFAQQVIAILPSIRRCFVQLITSDQVYKRKKYCSKVQQINILNKIAIFIKRLIQKSQTILPQDQFQTKIIQHFLINPQNILKQLFQRMTFLSKDFRTDKLTLIQTATDHLANYLMQVNLTRNTLYRATYDVMIKIVFLVLEYLKKDQVAEIVAHLLFRNYEVITRKPKQLKYQPQIIMRLELSPLDIITLQQGLDKTILTTDLSLKVTDFVYCNRMNFRKYGPNFMYDANAAFHYLKALNEEQMISSQDKILNIRKNVFSIQLVNCLKSLYFSYQSLTKSYFQLLYLLTNTGPIGQNLSIYPLDKHLPQPYQSSILQNKYYLKNQFSFTQSIHLLKSLVLMGNQESIVTKIIMIMEEFLTSVQVVEEQGFEVVFINGDVNERDITALRGIPRNAMFVQRTVLQTKQSSMLNPSHVLKVLPNICTSLLQHLPLHQDPKPCTQRYLHFLQYFYHILTKYPFSLRIALQCFSSILTQYSQILQLSTDYISKLALIKEMHQSVRLLGSESRKTSKIHEDWLAEKRLDELRMKYKVIEMCSDLLYRFYEGRRHSKMFNLQSSSNPPTQQQPHTLITSILKPQLQLNINLICCLTSQIYTTPSPNTLFSTTQQSQLLKDIHSAVLYIIRLLVDNLESYENRQIKVLIFMLCNKFYFVNERCPVTQWQFHSVQFEKCKEVLLRNVMQKQHTQQKLQRMIAFDSFCTFALTNDITPFSDQLLPILFQIINLDHNPILKLSQQSISDRNPTPHHSIPHTYYPSSTKRYHLSEPQKEHLTIDKLVEYKKLLMTVLVTVQDGKWMDSLFQVEINALYLEVLRLKVVDFEMSRLNPSKPVEERLNQLIVTDQVPYNLSKKAPIYMMQNNYQNNLPQTSFRNSKNIIPPSRTTQLTSHTKSKPNQPLSASSGTRMSLFDFICFIQHSELIHTFLLIFKTGIQQSKIFQEFGGFFFQPDQQVDIVDNIESKLLSLYEYFSSCADTLLDNSRMVQSLTYLYNYICKDPSYIKQFNNLPLFFDEIDPHHVRNQLVFSIVEYCTIVAELMPKVRQLNWKASINRNQQRVGCLNKCIRLLQKNKVVNAFRELNLYDQLYNTLKQELINEMKEEQSPKKQSRTKRWDTRY